MDRRFGGSGYDGTFSRKYEFVNGKPYDVVTVGGKTYRELDDGYQNRLIEVDLTPPAVRAGQRRTAARVQTMIDHPLAGAAYGVASMVGASPRARDAALAGGAAASGALTSISPRAAQPFTPARQVRSQADPKPTPRDAIRYGDVGERGHASGVGFTLASPMQQGTQANKKLKPPGWLGNGRDHQQDRAHLLANVLGGTGEHLANIVTFARQANQRMWNFEKDLLRRYRSGEVLDGRSIPFYRSGQDDPEMVFMPVTGSRERPVANIVRNTPRPRK